MPPTLSRSELISWNKSRERELSDLYPAPPTSIRGWFTTQSDQTLSLSRAGALAGSTTSYIHGITKDLSVLQRDLSNDFSQYGDFESKWRALTQTRREEIVLEGISSAYNATPAMARYARWCPELTLKNLATEGPDDFIGLVKKSLLDDLSDDLQPPVLVSNRAFDELLVIPRLPENQCLRILVDKYRLERGYFLTFALWNIFNNYVG